MTQPPDDRFFIDFPARIRRIQSGMAQRGIDLYLGSRLRTLSWTLDAFCPWRSFVVIPAEGLPTAFTFVIDASRVGGRFLAGPGARARLRSDGRSGPDQRRQ